MIKKLVFVICDISLRSHFVSDDNNPSRFAITCILGYSVLAFSFMRSV